MAVVQDGGAPALGIDLGGTKILVGVVGADNTILGRAKCATPAKEGGEAILAAMAGVAREAMADARVDAAELLGIGVGSPGPLDAAAGVILFSANLNVKEYPLGFNLSRLLDRPVLLRNDVRVGGYGEFRLGAGRGYQDILAAFVGTGIGGCLVMNGEVVAGKTDNAGEIGHIVVKAGGPRCGCGRRGCLEALASRSAIARRVYKAIRKGTPTLLSEHVHSKTSRLKSRELAAAFAAEDPVAVNEVRRAAHFLGLALGGLANLIGPEIIIVGGGVVEALGAPYLELIRAAAHSQILVDPDHLIKIEPAELGDDAGILGAALMAREYFANR